jgi:hypothetical protein
MRTSSFAPFNAGATIKVRSVSPSWRYTRQVDCRHFGSLLTSQRVVTSELFDEAIASTGGQFH